jgi:signal transduction histidine kinase
MSLRFDDTLETVLAADLTTPYGVQSAWRQLTDLVGRRRVPVEARVMETLRAIRAQVPLDVRIASARALEFADPPHALVQLFALDGLGSAGVEDSADVAPDVTPASGAGRMECPPIAGSAGANDQETGAFEVTQMAARIDAYWRDREAPLTDQRTAAPATQFRFETDAEGVIRWVEGVCRGPLIGLSLRSRPGEGSRIDASAAGAFRHRTDISKARMRIAGESEAAGEWLVCAVPVFDPASGRFTGYRGTGRRPRADERVEPVTARPAADSLRQLVHELRTPTNAIAGFAEMIESEMIGPVPEAYRRRAEVIRMQARELLGAIDDLDLAARIDSAALALVPGAVPLRPLIAAITDDLAPLAELRGAMVTLPVDDFAVVGDGRAVERLLSRLMATLVSASGAGERIEVRTALEGSDMIAIAFDRPRALAEYPGDTVLGIDDEREDASLLGTGFALRLARNLARELGGSLVIEASSLTLRLRAAVISPSEQAHSS